LKPAGDAVVISWINPRVDLARLSDSELVKRVEDALQALDASWPRRRVHRWTAYLAVREIGDLLDEIKRRVDARGGASKTAIK
jgi:hypothetical protein